MTDEVINRLKNIEGHITAIRQMAANEANLFELVGQIKAVQAALHQIKLHLLVCSLHTCLANVVQPNKRKEQEQMFEQIIKLFEGREKYH